MKIAENKMKLAGSLCDRNGKLKLSSVIERFVDMTGEQTDIWETQCVFPGINASWIINKYDIVIYRFPEKDEMITLRTYQSRYTRHFCERVFAVLGENGDILIKMLSYWSMRDFDNMKIVSVPQEYSHFTYEEEMPREDPAKMTKNVVYEKCMPLYIRTDDFDTNMHVNNAKYFSFMYECDDVMDYERYELSKVILSFSGGINDKCGNIMHYSSEDTPQGKKLFQKIVCNDSSVACISESFWREK